MQQLMALSARVAQGLCAVRLLVAIMASKEANKELGLYRPTAAAVVV